MQTITLMLLLLMSSVAMAEQDKWGQAKQGAPHHISDNASILIWQNGQYIEKQRGSNEFVCLIWADIKGTFEPSCFNKAAQLSVLPVYQYQRKMLEQGMKIQDIHQQIALKAQQGEFISPAPGAAVYMMAKTNQYFDHFNAKLHPVSPHIMLYYPRIEASDLGFNGKNGMPSFYNDFPHLSVVHIHTQ